MTREQKKAASSRFLGGEPKEVELIAWGLEAVRSAPAERCLLGLLEYWEGLQREPGKLPGRQHLDPVDIPTRVLPYVVISDVERDPFRVRFRLVGTRVVAGSAFDFTGRYGDEVCLPERRPEVYGRAERVCVERVPCFRRGPPRVFAHHDSVAVQAMLLPLARDGETVDMLLCGMTYCDRFGRWQ